MNRLVLSVAVLAALFGAGPAGAAESARKGAFELRADRYRPNIDSEFGGAATPYSDAFGSGKGWMFRFEVSRSVLKRYGTLDLGIGSGYSQDTGKGRNADGTVSADRTTFRIIPIDFSVTYRLDVLPSGFAMPLVPYVRFSLERYNWWTTGADTGPSEANGHKGSGATNGYSFKGGVAFLLDLIDRDLAREMDQDTGINHSYLFFDVTKSVIDDFGSSKSWDLSNTGSVMYGMGLMFVY